MSESIWVNKVDWWICKIEPWDPHSLIPPPLNCAHYYNDYEVNDVATQAHTFKISGSYQVTAVFYLDYGKGERYLVGASNPTTFVVSVDPCTSVQTVDAFALVTTVPYASLDPSLEDIIGGLLLNHLAEFDPTSAYYGGGSLVSRLIEGGMDLRLWFEDGTDYTDCEGEGVEGVFSQFIRKLDNMSEANVMLFSVLPEGAELLDSGVWFLGPTGVCIDPPVEATFGYNTIFLGTHNEGEVFVAVFDPDTMSWQPVPGNVEEGANQVKVYLSSFSTYGVFAGELSTTTTTTELPTSTITTTQQTQTETPAQAILTTLLTTFIVALALNRKQK